MKTWRIVVRRDTVYIVKADTFNEACETARYGEEYDMDIEEIIPEWETILTDESWEILEEEIEKEEGETL